MPTDPMPQQRRPLTLRDAWDILGAGWELTLSHMLGISPRALQRWESGQNAIPQPVADRVAALLAIARESRAAAAAERTRRNAE